MHTGFPRRRPTVIAHRGVSSRAIENSMRAFRLAVENPWGRCDAVELDIHNTSDGEFVVHHDSVLRSGRDISTLESREVRAELLADGSRIPTLSEALTALVPLTVHIEVKRLHPEYDGLLLDCIRRSSQPTHCQLHSFDHRLIARLGSQAPELSTGVLSSSYPLDPIGPVLEAGARVLWQESGLIDRRLVETAQKSGIAIIAWTVNDRDEGKRLAEIGVSGLCGNWPERLSSW